MEQVWRPLADVLGKWCWWIFSNRQRLPPSTKYQILVSAIFSAQDIIIGFKVDENLRLFGLSFFRASTLPCKFQSVQSCIENFCCNITGANREITGYRYWGSGSPQILCRGSESCTNCVFCRKWRPLWSWVCVMEQIFITHAWEGTAAYQGWILLLRSQFRNVSRMAWNMTKTLTSQIAKSSKSHHGSYKGKNFHSQQGPLKLNVHQK